MSSDDGISILRRPEVVRRTGLSNTRIDVLEKAGKFPARVRISERATGWRSDEVDEWIRARPRASDAPPDPAGDPRSRGLGRRRSA